MTGFNPAEKPRLIPNCVECGVQVCKKCRRCHTFHCNAELLCDEEEVKMSKYKYKVNECYFCGVVPAFLTVEHPTTRKDIFICTDHLESEYEDGSTEMYGHVYDLQFLKDMQLALQEEELRYRMEHGGTYNE